MRVRMWLGAIGCAVLMAATLVPASAQAQGRRQPTDWQWFDHYPYVLYYPQNFQWPAEVDHRYSERQTPVYNKSAGTTSTQPKSHTTGVTFILDVF